MCIYSFFISISHWINADQNLKEVGTHNSKASIPALADSAAEISCCQQMCWAYTGMIQSRSLSRSYESSFPLRALFLSLCINCRRLIKENPFVDYSMCGRCLIISNEQSDLVKKCKTDVNNFNIDVLLPLRVSKANSLFLISFLLKFACSFFNFSLFLKLVSISFFYCLKGRFWLNQNIL